MTNDSPAAPSPLPSAVPGAGPKFLRALAGERFDRPPVWFMRQAGR